jgi:ATP-dependent DNA helicase RecQ
VKADIEKLLLLNKPLSITTGFDRPNLYFEVLRPKRKSPACRPFLPNEQVKAE